MKKIIREYGRFLYLIVVSPVCIAFLFFYFLALISAYAHKKLLFLLLGDDVLTIPTQEDGDGNF